MLIALLHPEHRVATCGGNGCHFHAYAITASPEKMRCFFFWLEIQTYVHELALF